MYSKEIILLKEKTKTTSKITKKITNLIFFKPQTLFGMCLRLW
jgi:hypothetical protein